jgi:hypothetical protein
MSMSCIFQLVYGTGMMVGGKLERDISNVESGEFATTIEGGDEQYIDLPRCVEFMVSLTRRMPPLISEKSAMDCSLKDAASAGSLHVFDRKARNRRWLCSRKILLRNRLDMPTRGTTTTSRRLLFCNI